MRQLDRPDLRGFVPRQKPSEFRLVLKLTRPENHSLERRKAFLPGGWIFLSTRGRILISANVEVFQLIGHGLNSRAIAGRLSLKPTAVDNCRARIKEKLEIKNAAELYQRAAQWMAERSL